MKGRVDGEFYLVLHVAHPFPGELWGEGIPDDQRFQQKVISSLRTGSISSLRTGSIFTNATALHGVRPRRPIVDGQLCSCWNGHLRRKGKASTIRLDNRVTGVQPTKSNIGLTSGTESQDTE